MPDIAIAYVLITTLTLVIFFGLELLAPARAYDRSLKRRSYRTNGLVFLSNTLVTTVLSVSAVYALVLSLAPNTGFFAGFSPVVQGIVGILVLDFCIWLWHVMNHRLPLLWAFHKCHHSEQYLNVTSALRFHIGELLLSVGFKAMVLIVTGIPLWVFLLNEFLITAFAMFHHANIALPRWLRGAVEAVIISPRLHRVHHSTIRSEHDSNYGVIFSWWDIVFRTRRRVTPKQTGLAAVPEKNLRSFLTFPFRS